MREFNLDKKFMTMMKISLVIFMGFVVLGVSLPFIPDDGDSNEKGTLILSIICTAFFGILTIFAWKTLKKLPYVNIAADNDGLWYKHKQKKHDLVTWKNIDRIKERIYMQCLDLLDSDGRKLIRVEYQLKNFEKLRSLINNKICLSNKEIRQTQFSKNIFYHMLYIGSIIGFLCLGVYVGENNNPTLVYGAVAVLVILLAYEYLTVAYSLTISKNELIVSYPMRKSTIVYTDITNIKMADSFNNGNRQPEVWALTKNRKKPYKFKQLGVDANTLFAALNNVMSTAK
ncbi:MAG: hypothetical protein GY699_25545 [Desulfobacteraceae bacterium]|nr:hypothetical protein [Desulfobacteraceae bacterium]